MHGNLEPEEKVMKEKEKKDDKDMIPKLDGYACPYPRRKLNALSDH